MIRWLIPLIAIAACSKKSEPTPETKANPATPSVQRADTPVSHDSAVKFCAQCYFKMMDCFKDNEFWQVFSTMYFANTKVAVDEAEREQWIGVMKEDLLKLYNAREFEKNCEASVQHNKAPSEHNMTTVNEAANKSCAAFGSAFGYMVFNEGVFHRPK